MRCSLFTFEHLLYNLKNKWLQNIDAYILWMC